MILYLRIIGAVLSLVGISALIIPNATLSPLGIESIGAQGLSEIRANYGGMYLAIGVFLGLASVRPRLQHTATVFATLLTSGLLGGRIVSLLVDGYPNILVGLIMLLEAAAMVWGLVLLSSRKLGGRGNLSEEQ